MENKREKTIKKLQAKIEKYNKIVDDIQFKTKIGELSKDIAILQIINIVNKKWKTVEKLKKIDINIYSNTVFKLFHIPQ